MKKIFIFIAVCAMTVAASAQIVSSSSRKIVTETKEFTNYSRIFVSYAPMSFSGDIGKHMDTATGFALGWQGGWSVSKIIPLYVEGGLNLRYCFYSKNEETDNYLSLNLPVNIAYKFSIPGVDGLSLVPYLGLHLTGSILGTATVDDETYNFFSEDDMGDNTANRFQFGWQIGVGVNYKSLYLGVGYSAEFTQYFEDVNTGGLTLSLGLNF